MDNSLIKRQDAIDAILNDKVEITPLIKAIGNEYGFEVLNETCDRHAKMLRELPSAEPQIIRCEDCKHRDPEDKKCDCGHDIQWQLPRRDDWYCADAEMRMEVEHDMG